MYTMKRFCLTTAIKDYIEVYEYLLGYCSNSRVYLVLQALRVTHNCGKAGYGRKTNFVGIVNLPKCYTFVLFGLHSLLQLSYRK